MAWNLEDAEKDYLKSLEDSCSKCTLGRKTTDYGFDVESTYERSYILCLVKSKEVNPRNERNCRYYSEDIDVILEQRFSVINQKSSYKVEFKMIGKKQVFTTLNGESYETAIEFAEELKLDEDVSEICLIREENIKSRELIYKK